MKKQYLMAILLFVLPLNSFLFCDEFVSYVGWLDMLTTQGPNANNQHLDPDETGQLYIFALEENTTVSVYYTTEIGESMDTPSQIENHLLEDRGNFVTWFNDITQRGYYNSGIEGNNFFKIVSDKPVIWEMSQRHGYNYVYNCDFHYTVLSLNGSYKGREFYTGIVRTTDGTDEIAKFSVYNPSSSNRTVSFWRWSTTSESFSIVEGDITVPAGEIALFEPETEGTYYIESTGDIFLTKGRGYPGTSDNNDWFHFAMDWNNGTKIGNELYGQYGGDWNGNKIMIYAYHDLNYQLQVKSYPKDSLENLIFGESTTDNWRTIHTGSLSQQEATVFSPQTPDSANVLFHWETDGDRTGGFFRVLTTAPASATGGADFYMRGWNQGEILYDKYTYIPEGRFFPFFIPYQEQSGLNDFLWDGPSLVVIAPNASTEIELYRDGELFDTHITTNNDEATVWNMLGNNHHYEVVASNFVYCNIQAEGGYEKAFGLSQATISRIIYTTIETDKDTVSAGEEFEVTITWEIEDRGTGDTDVEISFEIPPGFSITDSQIDEYTNESGRLIWDLGQNSPGSTGEVSFTLIVESQAQQNHPHLLIGGGRLPDFMQRPNNSTGSIFVRGVIEEEEEIIEPVDGIVTTNISVDKQTVVPGELVTIYINWSMEDREHNPTNLDISLLLPNGFNYVSSSREPLNIDDNVINWVLENRQPGSGATIEVFALVDPNISDEISSYTITSTGILPEFMDQASSSQVSVRVEFPVEPPIILELTANKTLAYINDTISISVSAIQFDEPFLGDTIKVLFPERLFSNGQIKLLLQESGQLREISSGDTIAIYRQAQFLVTSTIPGNFNFNLNPQPYNTLVSPGDGLRIVFIDKIREIFITWSSTDSTDLADTSRIVPTLVRSFTLYLWALQENGEYIRLPGEWIVAEDSMGVFDGRNFSSADSSNFLLTQGKSGAVKIAAQVEIDDEIFYYETAYIFIFDRIAVGVSPNPAVINNGNSTKFFAFSPVKLSFLVMHIFDKHGNFIKKLSGIRPKDSNGDFTESVIILNSGSYEYACETWDFTNNSGNSVNTGVYIVVAEGKSESDSNVFIIRDAVPFYFINY